MKLVKSSVFTPIIFSICYIYTNKLIKTSNNASAPQSYCCKTLGQIILDPTLTWTAPESNRYARFKAIQPQACCLDWARSKRSSQTLRHCSKSWECIHCRSCCWGRSDSSSRWSTHLQTSKSLQPSIHLGLGPTSFHFHSFVSHQSLIQYRHSMAAFYCALWLWRQSLLSTFNVQANDLDQQNVASFTQHQNGCQTVQACWIAPLQTSLPLRQGSNRLLKADQYQLAFFLLLQSGSNPSFHYYGTFNPKNFDWKRGPDWCRHAVVQKSERARHLPAAAPDGHPAELFQPRSKLLDMIF